MLSGLHVLLSFIALFLLILRRFEEFLVFLLPMTYDHIPVHVILGFSEAYLNQNVLS